MKLHQLFPGGRFAEPGTEEALLSVEAELGVEIPAQVRSLYFECDGFRENMGNAKYLLSLRDEDGIGSVISVIRFMWQAEEGPRLRGFYFFGYSSGDEVWGVSLEDRQTVIAYHHHMGGQYEKAGSSVLDVLRRDFSHYDSHEE